jgi:uncharacterized protein YkwD
MLFYLVIVGLVATGGFAGVGPLAEDLATDNAPLANTSVDGITDRFFGTERDLNNQTVAQNSTVADERQVERLIHEEINEERAANGVDSLETDSDLRRVARGHSVDMIEQNYVGHESPDGVTPADRLESAGCSAGGENVAQSWIDEPVNVEGQTIVVDDEAELADHLVERWMASPGHRENVLRESFSESGVGVMITDDNRVYATQKFCVGSTLGDLGW